MGEYKLEHDRMAHASLLKSTIQGWSSPETDVYIISEEGHKIFTNRFLLSFYCSWLLESISSVSDHVGISLPVSSSSISNLLRILSSGIAISGTREELVDLQITAELMKIKLNNSQIGHKRRKSNYPLNSPSIPATKPSTKKSKFEGETGGGNFECVLCGFEGKDKYKLARHKRTHSKSLQKHPCEICQFSFRSREAVKKHKVFYHTAKAKEDRNESDVEIKVEDEEKNENTLEENEDPLGEGEDTEEKTVNEIPCGQCEKSFKNTKHLSRHRAIHSGVSHSCSWCSSTFARIDKLNAHIRKKHRTAQTAAKVEENKVEENSESSRANANNEDLQPEEQEAEVVDFEELLDE